MNELELAPYHLENQADEITEMKSKPAPYQNTLAGLEITVFPNVYPGGIDSELMCQAIGNVAGKSVLDLCAGTGVVSLVAAQRGASEVVAVDLNPAAVENARHNAETLGSNNIEVMEGPLFDPVPNRTFDVIAINPPYTSKRPADKTEICFWDENNQTTRGFFEQYKSHLNLGGEAYLGWANFSSLELIEKLSSQNQTKLELVASKASSSRLSTFLVYKLVPAG